jgi:hypothetical protein
MMREHVPAAELEEERSVLQALRAAASTLADDVLRFVGAAAFWLLLATVVLLIGRMHLAGSVLLLVLVPATAGIGRLAAYAFRGLPPRLPQVLEGARHRWPGALALGAFQLLVTGIALLNVDLGLTFATWPLVVAAIVSVNLGVMATVVGTTVWPLLVDPARDDVATSQLVRLGLEVVAVRPLRVLGMDVLLAAMLVVSLQTFVGALVLLPLGVLLTTHLVLPAADRLRPPAAVAAEGPVGRSAAP